MLVLDNNKIMDSILTQSFKFEVRKHSRFGRGCFAKSKIFAGEIICKMIGPTMSLKELLDKYDENTWTNPLQISEDKYIDLIEPYVCFNHSCKPNAGLRNKGILFALNDIEPNEEICYDYSTSVDDGLWRMDCDCLEENCRKIIGDFQTIPHLRKEFYKQENALTSYIMDLFY